MAKTQANAKEVLLAKRAALVRQKIEDPVLGEVYVRGLTGLERKWFSENCDEGRPLANQGVEYLCVLGWVDDAGNNLWTKEEVETVADFSLASLMNLATVISDISGFSKRSIKAIEKN